MSQGGQQEPPFLQQAADSLGLQGWAVVEDFLATPLIRALALAGLASQARGEFRRGRVGSAATGREEAELRGDSRCWLESGNGVVAELPYWAALEALRVVLNRTLFLGAFDVEAHYACYPPGAVYGRHVDQLVGSGERLVSTVLYLNEDWQAGDGGELDLWVSEAESRAFQPMGGRMVLFDSDRFEHEVLASLRDRWSITAWLRRRPGP